jgi:hypothetical protein
VLDEYGWCFPNKNVAQVIYYAQQGKQWALNRMAGLDTDGSPSWFKKTRYQNWAFLIFSDFNISDKCCHVMKISPIAAYEKAFKVKLYVGTLADESFHRKQAWTITGCNAFDASRPISKPLSFWTTHDILTYIKRYNLPLASVYGNIVQGKNGRLRTTGETQTGCVFCPIGAHLDKVNKFQRLAFTHPKMYDYCIYTLGLGKLLDYVGVKYDAGLFTRKEPIS